MFVKVLDTSRKRRYERGGRARWNRFEACFQPRIQSYFSGVRGRNVTNCTNFTSFVYRRQCWVVECRRQTCFINETLAKIRVEQRLESWQLKSHVTACNNICRKKDNSAAASTEFAVYLKLAYPPCAREQVE